MKNNNFDAKKIAVCGLMAALAFVGYTIFPAFSVTGTKVHIGNVFVVLAALILGGVYGGLSGAVGLTIADIVSGYAASAPRTFICKLLIGIVVGLFAHRIAHLNETHPKKYVIKWTIIATAAGLLFNCIFEPALKYVWYTILTPNADKAASAIKSLMALAVYVTYINAVINAIIAVILYNILRPVLIKLGVIKPVKF